MAKVKFCVIAENVVDCSSIGGIQGVPALIGPQLAIRPPVIPGAFSFCLAFGIEDIDGCENKEFRVDLIDPNGKLVQTFVKEPILGIKNDGILPKEHDGIMYCFDLRNVFFSQEGDFSFEFYVNSELIGNYNIPVYSRRQK